MGRSVEVRHDLDVDSKDSLATYVDILLEIWQTVERRTHKKPFSILMLEQVIQWMSAVDKSKQKEFHRHIHPWLAQSAELYSEYTTRAETAKLDIDSTLIPSVFKRFVRPCLPPSWFVFSHI